MSVKKGVYLLLLAFSVVSFALSPKVSKVIEAVFDVETGDNYVQCINEGKTCES